MFASFQAALAAAKHVLILTGAMEFMPLPDRNGDGSAGTTLVRRCYRSLPPPPLLRREQADTILPLLC